MTEELGAHAAGLLVSQAWDALVAGRLQQAASAAGRAVLAAGQLDDPVLLVRALSAEAAALRLAGDYAAALARYTRILGLAGDRATGGRLDDPAAARAVAGAHWNWVACARFLTGIPVRDLFGVLEAADRWLEATGHRDWRAAVLLQRADVHRQLGDHEAAVADAQEALAVAVRHPDAPGYPLAGHRWQLGDMLRDAGRVGEAAPHYQAILADPDARSWDRRAAHQGLAWCALAAGDHAGALREARRGVQLAEPLGDEALCTSLNALAAACRAAGDLDAAWQAATRYLEAAGRIGGHYWPYFAARYAVDIALDRADHAAARRLLAELDEHARAMDAATGSTARAAGTERRRQRLDQLTSAPSQHAQA